MYTEEYEKRGYPITNFIIKLVLVVIVILLLVWLVPKIIAPNFSSNSNNTSSCKGSTTCEVKGLDALTSQIFADNLERMKDAAITYYTADRLPTEVGDSRQMTLSDMIGKKLITPLIDKNNKAVDVEKSYVKITKMNDEYLLKINIKDSEKEDYILVHLGCYSYCDSYLCQKQTTQPVGTKQGKIITPVIPIVSPTPTTPTTPTVEARCMQVGNKYYDKNGNVVSEVNYIISCQAPKCQIVNGYYFGKDGTSVTKSRYQSECSTPTPTTHKCEYTGGKYYDINGNVVSEVNYIISCQAPKCKIVNGYYFGKDGRNVSKAIYEKECTTPTPTYKCQYVNGKYYDKNGAVVSEVNYIISCQAPKCQIVNGYYFGKDGRNVSKSVYESECSTPVEYEWEYIRTTGAKFSEWTSWSAWAKTDCSTQEINCSDTDVSCLYKLQRLTRKEKIGTYQKTYSKKREMVKQTGSYEKQSCANYNYVEINHKLYATTTTTPYTTIDTITTTTTHTTGTWTYNGRASYSNPPADSGSTHYKFVGADYSYCGETCTTLPNYYYDSYTYTGGLANVSTTTSSTTTAGTPLSETHLVGQTTTYAATCGQIVTKTIPIYGTITVTEKATRTEPLYGDVCYKSDKSRTLISEGKTETTWSSYNNSSLINAGWKMTGNKRSK